MTSTQAVDAVQALRAVAQALLETVQASGDAGAPAGHLYVACMGIMNVNQFDAIMRALVSAGKVTKRGHCYYPMAAS